MELGDIVIVDQPRHPFYGKVGKIIGKRGFYAKDDPWILIYVPDNMRSFLVPQSMLCPYESGAKKIDVFNS
ncbi:MAG: hypothetical protein N2317_01030 [Syntrophales bacterium]|nr:hypothetical protein [Syntrophales bacterium]